MSIYSGKCDVADHMAGMGGWFDREGNPIRFGEGAGAYHSDEMRDFIAFKEATGGKLYQHLQIEVTKQNQDFIAQKCSEFKVIEHDAIKSDKRLKTGQRHEKYYTYIYYGKEYSSLKELNKKHIFITKEICFNTLLDLIPYYPYIVTACCSDGAKQTVYISNRSYVDTAEEAALKHGYESSIIPYYRNELQKHYQEIVLHYFNPEGREHVEEVEFDPITFQAKVHFPIDTNFEVDWSWGADQNKSHWTSPKVIDAKNGIIQIHENDFEKLHNAKIYYVEDIDHPVILG